MAFVKRTWKDRISEFPNRRTINDGNVTKQVTVGRDEGAITEQGDSFDAANMNDLEQRIEDAYGDLQGLVASEVAQQYDSSNVIFDAEPTEGHGTGYTVTSEGIKTAIDSGLVHTKTVSGSIVHITDGADNIPVKSLVSEIVAVQSGSGTPSPSNPRTISGFDSGVVSVCGINLCDEVFETGDISFATGGNITGASWIRSKNYVPIVSGLTVYVKSAQNINIFFYDCNKAYLGNNSEGLKSNIKNTEITVSSKARYFRIATNQTPYNNDISINYPSSDTQYHAYNGNTYTFTFGQTVYGGYFSNKGNEIVTHKEINLSTLSWSATTLGSQNVWRASLPTGVKGYADNFVPTNILCEQYKPNSVDNMYSGYSGISLRTSGNYIYCSRTDLNEPQGKLIAELITPTSLTISSQDIPTILGENNIFSNCGDLEVTYYVDTEAIYAIRDVIDEFAMQSDWNEADNTKADYIKNKPTIPANADFSLSGLSDTDISSASAGQVLTFDGDNWVNSNIVLPSVKYEEINVTFDASGEGTLFNSVKFVVGLKDIPSDQLYVGYVSYIAGSTIKIKALSRTAIAFSSQNNVSSTRKVGVYYLDNIATQ